MTYRKYAYKLPHEYEYWKILIHTNYKKHKKKLLYLHNIAMISDTILAITHGLTVESDNFMLIFFGWTAIISKVILTLSGIIIWDKFTPIWLNSYRRKIIKFIHLRWIISIIFIVSIIIHTG